MNPSLRQVRDIVLKEIKYLSKFYPYNIKRFSDPTLLHSTCMTVFLKSIKGCAPGFLKGVVNLLAGIELLATGVNLHSFNVKDFKKTTADRSIEQDEKDYTVDLLFGDVFYSRSVIYILEYGDFYIFDSILDSLKCAHENRLLLHRDLVKILGGRILNQTEYPGDHGNIDLLVRENGSFITGINSLMKTSFFLGWGIFADHKSQKLPYKIINDLLMLKSLNDLDSFLSGLKSKDEILNDVLSIGKKKQQVEGLCAESIDKLQPEWLKNNFVILKELLG